jgi:hypothetical protein
VVHRRSNEYQHTGGGLTSVVMDSIISKLPPVHPNSSGVRGDSLMRTVRLSGDYQADVPLILPSFTRLVLDGSIAAVPYKLSWMPGSAGPPNMTASLVSATNASMVSVEGGHWSCAQWNSSSAQGNTTDVTAVFFDHTSFSFIRNLNITLCGGFSGAENSLFFSFAFSRLSPSLSQQQTVVLDVKPQPNRRVLQEAPAHTTTRLRLTTRIATNQQLSALAD